MRDEQQAARCELECSVCLVATATVLELRRIGSSPAPTSCLCTGRKGSGQVTLPLIVQGRSEGVGGRRARSREGGRRVLSWLSPTHRAFIGRVLRDTRHRLCRERRLYAGKVP